MVRLEDLKEQIKNSKYDETLKEIYVDENLLAYQKNRYLQAIAEFEKHFPEEKEVAIFSTPGRSEVCGNHTDHQNGMVLATSINLDAIAVVAPTKDGCIRLVSEERPMEQVSLSELSADKKEEGTTAALIRGVAAGFGQKGYKIGGFCAYVTSDVLVGAGLSSSAAFEGLIGVILSGLYNDGDISSVEIAKIGQYAENVYFGKPCGLMDQMACSVGGMIFIDFEDKEKPVVQQVPSDFAQAGYSLCIVDTKGSHADLTPDYAAVPAEMNRVAKALGKDHLREIPEEIFYEKIPEIIGEVGGRAVLRAIHFYNEEKRVLQAVEALKEDDYTEFLQVIKSSGDSSAKYLQNIYSPKQVDTQNMTVALGVTESLLGMKGVCRVHGGGFAGTIQVFVKTEAAASYAKAIDAIYGEGSCHILKVRARGGICVME